VQLSHKIRLYPNQQAGDYFVRACGISRFAYNWALARWKEKYEAGDCDMSGYSLVKEFNAVKADEFPWTSEVTKWAPQKAIQDLGDAFRRFFKKVSRYPKFKKKGIAKDGFYLGIGHFQIDGKYLRIPKLGWVRMAQELRFPGKTKSIVIGQEAGRWYASVLVEVDDTWEYPHRCETQAVVGIDLGIKTLATLSDGSKYEGPKALITYERKLRRLSKSLSRKKKGSRNRNKARQKLARLYARIKNVRKDYTHKLTAEIVRTNQWIGIENLNIKGMSKLRSLSKRISDVAWRELRRQLEYKSILAGSNIIVADRFFPSSKTCSSCGHKLDELSLAVRQWSCPYCKDRHDRDVNAAINLQHVAARVAETKNACGGSTSTLALKRQEQVGPVKQEKGNSFTTLQVV
jgi:putative transposase